MYAALAGTCVAAAGEEVRLVQEGDDPLGLADVVLQRVGFVTLSSDLGYALVRIDEANMDVVDPSMRGHPDIPTEVSTAATSSPGDLARISGYGGVYRAHELVRENRVGVLTSNDGTRHGVAGPTLTNGDHGAPVANVTDGNTALGIVTHPEYWLLPTSPWDGATGLSVEGLLADALEQGWDLRLRTVEAP